VTTSMIYFYIVIVSYVGRKSAAVQISILPILCLLLIPSFVLGQKKTRLVKILPEIVTILTMQRDCRLKAEPAEFLLFENGSDNLITYQVENVSSKVIKSFWRSSVSIGGGRSGWPVTLKDQDLLVPNEVSVYFGKHRLRDNSF
jgi:hypothetical protein